MVMKLRPTKGLIAYVLVLVLSAAPAALSNGPVGYVPCLTLLFGGILSLAHLLLVKDRLRCQAAPERALLRRGEETPFRVSVENRCPLPVPALRMEFFLRDSSGSDDHSHPLTLSLSPKEVRSFSLSASFPHVGVYEAGLRRLEVRDLFGIFRAVSREEVRCRLEVQPRLHRVETLPLSQKQTAENDRARVAAPLSGMEYTGVREYAYGDPIKTIQWKLSAHAASLMTKEMESYASAGVTIILDFCVPTGDRETRLVLADGVAETGTAAGSWAMERGLEYQLLLPGDDGQPRQCTPSSFRDLRAWLPNLRLRDPDETGRLAQVLLRQAGDGRSLNDLLLCTAALTEETVAALVTLKQNRKNPAVCLLVPEQQDEVRRKTLAVRLARLESAGIPCRTGKTAEEVLR
jgi:uncharacterized protein (DUF58 family)